MPAACSASRISRAFGSTVSSQLPRGIGTITTWYGRNPRRQDQAVVVAVHHDRGADQPRGHAPRRRPHVLQRLVATLELNLRTPSRNSDRGCATFPPATHGRRRISASTEYVRAAPANFSLSLFCPSMTGIASSVSRHSLYSAEDLQRFFLRLVGGLVCGVPFLPQELGRAKERPRHLLPADDVRPLIDQDGQVAPRLNPLRVQRADDHFGRRPDDERLGELLIAAARHPRDLRRKAFDVLLLLHQQAGRDEEREVRVDVPGGLDPASSACWISSQMA